MAIQECSGCGAQVQPDGTSPCSCVLAAADEVDAAFKGHRPQGRTRSSWRIVGRPPQPVLVQSGEERGLRGSGRVRGAALGLVMATMVGTLAFVVGAANSGQPQHGESPFPSSTGVGVLPRPVEGNAAFPGGEFGKGASPGPSRSDAQDDRAAADGDAEEPAGTPPSSSEPSSEVPSSPSDGAAGGGSDGGTSDGGTSDGGSSDGGSSDGGSSEGGSQSPSPSPSGDEGGASDGGSTEGDGGADGGGGEEDSGGLLGGLLGGILG
ncbi:hypothetical protein H181DRAFT_00539 [Streptomyces sp. WMMB 714]|uniref:hypothetical protein n=1 Tax=Streptomyces sp. WMMB 714 TaxID=1286822 RepID=UPI000823CAEB|nr:hypothetical protein [Streptomyces sp. WMMB 714]SCK10190.1 hypothetical protein H181DRAFT_00539 [Streptomyces sp. WMMB 714]